MKKIKNLLISSMVILLRGFLVSFEDKACAFDEVDRGNGNINDRWQTISIIVDFRV